MTLKAKTGYLTFFIAWILLALGFFSASNWDSDSMYMEIFQANFFRDIALGDRWHQMPASAYFPDQIVYYFSRLFFPINTALFIVATIKALLLNLAMYFFCRHALDLSKAKSLIFSFSLLVLYITPYRSGNSPLFRIEYNHFSAVFFGLIVATFLLKPIGQNKSLTFIISLFIGIIASVSSPASLPIIGIMSTIIILVTRWEIIKPPFQKENYSQYKPLLLKSDVIAFLALSAGLISGYLLYSQHINPNWQGDRIWPINNSYPLKQLEKSFRSLYKSLYIGLGNQLTLFVIFSNFFLAKKLSHSCKFSTVNKILLLSFPLTFIAFGIGGGIWGSEFHRYFTLLVIITVLNTLYGIEKQQPTIINKIVVFIAILSILQHKKSFRLDGSQFATSPIFPKESQLLASCIKNKIHPKEGEERITIGVFNYLDANMTQIQIPSKKIDILNLDRTGKTNIWMQNLPKIDSIINRFYLAKKEGKTNYFPIPPQTTIDCADGKWSLLGFGSANQQAVDFMKKYSSYLFNQLDITTTKTMWHGNKLKSAVKHKKIASALISYGPGYAHFGPYIDLAYGAYSASVFYTLNSTNPASQAKLEVGCKKKSKQEFVKLATKELSLGIAQTANLDFIVTSENECQENYEIRTWIDKTTTMNVNHITIYKKDL